MKIVLLIFSSLQICLADLRLAAQPKPYLPGHKRDDATNADMFRILYQSRRRYQRLQTTRALYFEPSAFNYEGLENQREKAYDNFLRSNIDNEQDRRNFNEEDGRDHLPFRTFEGAVTDVGQETILYKIPPVEPGTNLTVTPGVPMLVPLRWNNPHSSELEVNVWIVNNKYVVPIRKPTCSGEGYQDNAFSFTIPTDFNNLKTKVPGFQGCTQVGQCVLQIYAHSVESRTYAIGIPLIVTGYTAGGATTNNENQIQAACTDVGTDLSTLRLLCRPSNDATANIETSVPHFARLVSDVYNHAYQNRDYSPYSGQQCTEISKNLQASAVLKMLPANRGELGQKALIADNRNGFFAARSLDRKAKQLYKRYESMANSFIKLLEHADKTTGTIQAAASHVAQFEYHAAGRCKGGHMRSIRNILNATACQELCKAEDQCMYVAYTNVSSTNTWCRYYRYGDRHGDCSLDTMQEVSSYTAWKKVEVRSTALQTQTLENCFRCAEVGSTVGKRHETTTYIPSFKIQNQAKCDSLKTLLADNPMYRNIISTDCHVNIYVTTLNDLVEEFNAAIDKNITYLGPMIKQTVTTMEDTTKFKKLNAEGEEDRGLYAAREAYKKHGGPPWKKATPMMLRKLTPTVDTATGATPPTVPAETLAALSQPCPLTDCFNLPSVPMGGNVADAEDMDAQMADGECDDPTLSNDTTDCKAPTEKLFADFPDLEAEELGIALPTSAPPTSGATTGETWTNNQNQGIASWAIRAYHSAVFTLPLSFVIAMA